MLCKIPWRDSMVCILTERSFNLVIFLAWIRRNTFNFTVLGIVLYVIGQICMAVSSATFGTSSIVKTIVTTAGWLLFATYMTTNVFGFHFALNFETNLEKVHKIHETIVEEEKLNPPHIITKLDEKKENKRDGIRVIKHEMGVSAIDLVQINCGLPPSKEGWVHHLKWSLGNEYYNTAKRIIKMDVLPPSNGFAFTATDRVILITIWYVNDDYIV